MPQEQPSEFSMKDLFIDVKLEACVNGTTFDFLGRKLFSTEFFREGIGFGITGIDIEINTSLQPLVTVTFKDLYGLTVFGGQDRNPDNDGQSHDYSVLFNWPPPKFLFSFKGYLGKPASWVLNLKRTTTSFNSSDGSYDIKCEFVPNQWGFFADLPFLYLLAAKRLRKDRLGPQATQEDVKNVISVFDLIKIGKQVEVKTQDTTKEFDDLVKQLGSLKTNLARSIVATNIVSEGEKIEGIANNQPVVGFITIEIPTLSSLDQNLNDKQKIDIKLGNAKELNTLNTYLLLSLKFNGKDSFGAIPKSYETFNKRFNAVGGDEEINTAKANALNIISKNLEKIDDEIKRRVFASSQTKLEKITIGEIFSQLAKDAAFVMGSILDAGLDGYRGDTSRQQSRNVLVEKGRLIGESFPLTLKEGEEVPATKENLGDRDSEGIDVDEHEMQFVKNFINAVTEGIAKDLLENNEQSGQDDGILKQRINNMEMSSPNPYKSYYSNIATNVLVRGGIAAYFTRSNDPNLPGQYTNLLLDRDDIQSIQELADRDMQNITDNILKNLSDVDFLLLKRFATFFSRYFTVDCTSLALASGKPAAEIPNFVAFDSGGSLLTLSPTVNPITWKVVMSNPNQTVQGVSLPLDELNQANTSLLEAAKGVGVEYLTFQQIWNELANESLLQNISIVGEKLEGFSEYEDAESRREDQNIGFGGNIISLFEAQNNSKTNGVRNANNPLSFVNTTDFTATRIVNNGIAYMYPTTLVKYEGTTPNSSPLQPGKYMMVLFEGEDHQRALEANTAPTDSEFKNSEKDTTDAGQNEPTGYVALNAKYGDKGDETTAVGNGKFLLNRVATLVGYRDGTSTSFGDNVFQFSKCKNPGPNFYNGGDVQLKWRNSFVENVNETLNQTMSPEGFTVAGKVGYTICAHLGDDFDSNLVFGLFNLTYQGRNQRAYIRKCAEVILEKINGIEDERNQIIGEVLGKAGEQEGSIYKQMHTLFHQWQTLAYKDKKDANGNLCGDIDENRGGEGGKGSKVFDVATVLERRFGDNHKNLQHNEMICFSQEELEEGVNLSAEELQSLTQVSSGPNVGKICLNVADQAQSSSVPDGTFIYDYPLQRINKPDEPVDVRDSIINLEPLYKPNGNTTVLNIIQQVCTKNNFLFIPTPGNPGYLNVKDIYSPSREHANITIRNFFHVLFTPTPESRTKTRNTDGTALGNFANEQRTYNVNSFVIKYGHPDNQIVSNIQVGTDDNKVTAESIVNLQRLVDNENQNKKVTTDCSMLSVLAGRSYKASVDMLGNSQAYPMQFFFLENSPLFGGLYQVMKVKHSIEPNNMTTSMEGIRMRFSPGGDGYGSIKPITLQTFRALGESEAPLALGTGFDDTDREALRSFQSGALTSPTTIRANTSDFIGQGFVSGNNGGPIAQSVPIISSTELGSFDSSLGVRDLWSNGDIIGSKQMYIIDGYPVSDQILSAYKAMRDAAQADGITLRITSGYRDPFKNIVASDGRFISAAQYELRRQNVKDKSKVNDDHWLRTASSTSFNPETGKPGYSNHNAGIAIDLNCGGAKFNNFIQEIYEWLILNAYKYGFVRTVKSEEWHWEYRPGKSMFAFDPRTGSKWYGLPDKLGIPKDKPTEALTGTTSA